MPFVSFHSKYMLSFCVSLFQQQRDNFATNTINFSTLLQITTFLSVHIHVIDVTYALKIYELKKKHTGRVVCPASSIMHTSNLLLASRGLEMPKQVTATTLTCSNLILISSTLFTFVSVIDTSVKRFLFKNYDKLKGRVLVKNWQT